MEAQVFGSALIIWAGDWKKTDHSIGEEETKGRAVPSSLKGCWVAITTSIGHSMRCLSLLGGEGGSLV